MLAHKKLSSIVLGFAVVLTTGVASVRADPLKVYLLGGQSNMVGWITSNEDLPSSLQQPQTDVQIYHGDSWGYLRQGLGLNSSKFGPEVTFGRDTADAQLGENIALIKYAVGDTDLANDWLPPDANGQSAGPQYTAFMNVVTNALASLEPFYEPEIIGMIWMQGESDAWHEDDLSKAQAYELNLTNFIQSIRSDLGVPNMPFVIGQISTSPSWTWGDIVCQAQLNVSQTVPNTALVITSDLPRDSLHYSSAGTMTLGSRFADAMQNLEFATSSYSSSSEDTTLNWPHTICSGDSRILVVGIVGKDDSVDDLVISSIKYNDINMDMVEGASQSVYSSTMYVKTELYYLLDEDLPSPGTYNIVVTYNGNVSERNGGAISLANVEQQAAEAVVTNSNTDTNTISTNITTHTNGAWVVDVVGCDNSGTFTTTAEDMVWRWHETPSGASGAGSTRLVESAEETTMSWIHPGANQLAHSVAAFAPIEITPTISGYIREPNNAPVDGALVSADPNGSSYTADPNGRYEVLVPYGWSGTVTAAKTEYIFDPSERTYSNVITDRGGQDYKNITTYDLDWDGFIGWGDIEVISEHWLEVGQDIEGDTNNDEIVNLLDFAEFALAW